MFIFNRNENIQTYIKRFPVTSMILLLNIVMFVVLSFQGGSKNTEVLLTFGAFFKPFVEAGDWYRIVTSMFLHIGIEHLLFNMVTLYIFASALERLIGSIKYSFIYVLSGIAGSISVFLFSQDVVMAGASGAIFGVFGTFLGMMLTKTFDYDKGTKQALLVIIGINLIYTFIGEGVSIAGHIGGFLCGFILSLMIIKQDKGE